MGQELYSVLCGGLNGKKSKEEKIYACTQLTHFVYYETKLLAETNNIVKATMLQQNFSENKAYS